MSLRPRVAIVNDFVVGGLPLHPLLVHLVVVLGPLTALAVLLHAFWPAARRRLGFVTPLAALVLLVVTPITTEAGEALESQVTPTPAVLAHVALGETLLPWTIGLFAAALVLYAVHGFVLDGPRPMRMTTALRRAVIVVLSIAAVTVAAGYLVDVIRIGEAGARAVWGGAVG